MELENEIKELRSHCSCHKPLSSEEDSKEKVDYLSAKFASEKLITSEPVNLKRTVAKLDDNLTPLPVCQSLETSPLRLNDSETVGLKGILFDNDLKVYRKSSLSSPVEQRTFIVDRQKISTHDGTYPSPPTGGLEAQSYQVNSGRSGQNVDVSSGLGILMTPDEIVEIAHNMMENGAGSDAIKRFMARAFRNSS